MGLSRIIEEAMPRMKRSRWADNVFRPLLITIMIMCVSVSLVNMVRLINPDWSGLYFLLGMLITTVEALYSYRVLKSARSRGTSVFRYRLAEWTVLIVLLKLLSLLDRPVTQLWLEVRAIWQNPTSLISLEYYLVLLLAFIAWVAATATIANFDELHDPYTFRSDRIPPLDNLATRFFWGGLILVAVSGITQWALRAGFGSLLDFRRPTLGGVLVNVLIYFTAGLVLLSQARLTTLLTRWQIQKISVSPDVIRQWARYGVLFLGLVTVAVFFLPTGYTLGFLQSAALFIRYLIGVIFFLMELLVFLVALPFLWLLSLFGQSPTGPPPAAPAPAPFLPPQPAASRDSVPWLEVLRSLAFWLLAIMMVWYLVRVYVSDHPELVESLRRFKPLALLFDLLAQLWQALRGLAEAGLEALPRPRRSTGPDGRTRSHHRDRRQTPGEAARQQILYYYLNTLDRAKKAGTVRRTHQTPYEYEPDLSRTVPEAESAVNLLTQAFVHARYSRGPFHAAQAAVAKSLWQQIRRALKSAGQNRDLPKKENGDTPDSEPRDR